MIIEAVAARIAIGIKSQVPDHKASVSVLKHSIAILLNIVLIVTFTLAIAFLTGKVAQAATALIGFAILRQFSGGIHVRTGAGCILITTGLFTLTSFIDMSLIYTQT
ncbi:ABC transporter permease, partial [Clostridium perfringens]